LKIWRQASLSYRQRLRVNGSRVYPQIIFDTLLFLSEKVLTVHGEAAEVGGDRLFGCCPPAEQPLPEDGVSSGEVGARRSWCGAG
jgi:hypothetical protein